MTLKATFISQKSKTILNHSEYQWRWDYIEAKGRQLYGPKFTLHPADEEVIIKLIIWFSKEESGAEKFNIDLQKGIFLNGPVGCGKTSLMQLFASLLQFPDKHYFFACRDIALDYSQHGPLIIQKYSKSAFFRPEEKKTPIPMCFDDLGAEPDVQYYGNPCNPMAEILFSRYDYFISHQMITHITTNFNAATLEKKYGERIKSRLREMLNMISFKTDAVDKRK